MQNIYLGVHALGWNIDWKKFFIYLQKKHNITTVFLFLGYIKKNDKFYAQLKKWGYTLVFKKVVIGKDGKYKGNVDAELVLEVVDRISEYDTGILVSGDGDFLCLLDYWKKYHKTYKIIAVSKKSTSFLLRTHGRSELTYLSRLQKHLE